MSIRSQHLVSFLGVSLAVAVLGWGRPAAAQQIHPIEDGPINEGFVSPVTDVTALDAIEHEPPPEVTERVPPKPSEDAVWVKGYWEWDEDRNDEGDWVWTVGAWRRPPHKRYWIDGYWLECDAGWVRVRGFWSPVPADDITYIDEAPPEPFDEDPPEAPGRGYFWLAGHWHYSPNRGYERRGGRWEELDPNLVLVPANYLWRPKGYVYVSAYWDFPVERRGVCYRSIYVERPARVACVYEPVIVVEPTVVVGWCYYSYPNYTYLLHHHYHHNHDWWHAHHDVPTWWGWHSWWSLGWHDHWGAWWWYTHPGYRQPHFISASLASRIAPPSQTTIIKIKNVVKKPVIVTNNGVISAGETLQIAAKGKIKTGDGDKGGKSAPLVFAKATKEKAADVAEKSFAKKAKEKPELATTIAPTGAKKAKPDDEDDDPKKHPPKPKAVKAADGGTKTAAGGSTGKSTGVTPPLTGTTGKGKGKDDDKEKMKGKGSPPPPPIKSKTGKSDDKSDDKPGKPGDKPSDKTGKARDKDDDKPGKSGDKPTEKSKGTPPPTGERSKDSGKGTEKSKDKPDDKSGTGKPKPPDTKPKDSDKPREKPPETKPPKSDDKPPKSDAKPPKSDDKPKTGSGDKPKPPSPPPSPPASGSGSSGEKKKDKDKDKDDKKK